MRKLVLALSLAASSTSTAKVIDNLSYTYYQTDVSGAQSLATALSETTPHRNNGEFHYGLTTWNVRWRMQFGPDPGGACRVAQVETSLSVTIDLPKLVGANAAQKRQFKRFLTALRKHELGHYAIGREAAAAVDAKLLALPAMADCQALQSAASTVGSETINAFERKSDQYDVDTDNGRTQGAVLTE